MEQYINTFITVYLPLILAAWPLLALIAALTPTEIDNKVLAVLRKVLDAVAFNFGNAKNKSLDNKKPKKTASDRRANRE